MLRLTIWMNMPSFHQDDMFSALAQSGDIDLEVIFAEEMTSDRVRLGWKASLSGYRYRFLNGKFSLLQAMRIAVSGRDRLHIVNGIWAEPAFASALCMLAMSGSAFAIYSEAPDPAQTLSWFKRMLRKTFGKWVARRANGILAVSHFAIDFYTQLGAHHERIYPFGYFRASADRQSVSDASRRQGRTEVIFVGQLIRRKGVDILIEAMQPLFAEYPDLYLTVVGTGEDLPALQALIRQSGTEERITLTGVLPAEQVPARVSAAQALVLPSRWDGWGMVVNEALSVGVPVIVSDRCGVSDLIRHGINGYVFRSEDVEDLRRCLRDFLLKTDDRARLRSEVAITGQTISAKVAARYMIECMNHMTGARRERPIPPWAQAAISPSLDR
jgi:glycosyltransferase involved in cell wall biosynthesis